MITDANHNRKVQSRVRRARRNRHLNRYKLSKGCAICNYKEHPHALVWDHIEPLQDHKAQRVAAKMNGKLSKLFDEIRKCRLLCCNCHAIETHRLKQWKPRKD